MDIICPKCRTLYRNLSLQSPQQSLHCKKCGHRFIVEQSVSHQPQATQLAPPSQKNTPQETRLASVSAVWQPDKATAGSQSGISRLIGLGSECFAAQSGEADLSEHDWQTGDVLLDRYEVKAVLGEGQFGKVFQVRHRQWELDLALKTPKLKALAGGYETIEKEAATWVNLDLHPNIVNCYYVRRINEVPQIFSEYVDAGDLKERISSRALYRKGNTRALADIIDIAIQSAWGLHYAHQQGLIHQDIKPANIMLTSDGLVKITDFGLAKAIAQTDELHITGGGMTPAYASPEQLAGKPLSHSSDIWSWAVCVLEMVLGYCSWEAGAVAPGILEAWCNNSLDEPPALDTMPAALISLLQQCFQEAEADRPDSLQIIADNLQEIYLQQTAGAYPRQQPTGGSGTASSLNNQAISLLDLGRTNEAVKCWRNALSIDPRHFASYFNLCLYQWRNEGLPESELLEKIAAVLHQGIENTRESLAVKTALSRLYLQFGHYSEVIKLLNNDSEKIRQLADDIDPDSCKELGLALCAEYRLVKNTSHWQLVLDCLQKAMLNKPDDPRLISAYSLALQRTGDKQAAAEFFNNSSENGLIPGNIKQAVSLFLPGYEVLYRLAQKHVNQALFLKNTDTIVFNSGSRLVLMDVKSKDIIRELSGHTGQISAFDISLDETILISASEQGDMRLWELHSGEQLQVWSAHQEKINSLKITACGQFVYTASTDNQLCLWDIKHKSRVKSFHGEGHSAQILDIQIAAASASGDIATAGADNIIRIWEKKSGHSRQILSGHERPVTCVQWLDKQYILSASLDKTIRLWDLEEGRCRRVYKGHTGMINALSVDVVQGIMLSGSSDGVLRFWHIKSGMSYTLTRFKEAVKSIAMDESNAFALIVTPSAISLVETYNHFRYFSPWLFSQPESASEIDQLVRDYQQKIAQAKAALNKDNIQVMDKLEQARSIKGYERDFSAFKYWARLYAYFPRSKLKDFWKHCDFKMALKNNPARITALEISPANDKLYAVAQVQHSEHNRDHNHSHQIVAWDIKTGKSTAIFARYEQAVSLLKITADGSALLLAGGANIQLRDIKTERQLTLFCHHQSKVITMALTADTRFALSSDERGVFYLWRLLTGEVMADFSDAKHRVTLIEITPDGRFTLTAQSNNHLVCLWDMTTGMVISEFQEHETQVTALAVSSDGRYLLSGDASGGIRLWQIQSSRKQSLRIMSGHRQRINQLAIDYQGKIALSVSEDRTLKIWDLASGDCLHTLEHSSASYITASISPDAQFAFTGDAQGDISVWCLDWLLQKKSYHDWDSRADIYLKNYLATHKTTEPHKALKPVLSILNYAGYGWLDKNEVAIQLGRINHSELKAFLPASKLTRARAAEKRNSGSRKTVYAIFLSLFVLLLIVSFSDNDVQETQNTEIYALDNNEQTTINAMTHIALQLSRLNSQVVVHNGHLNHQTLNVPEDKNALQKLLKLQPSDLTDAWGHDFIYQSVKNGAFQGRISLRSAGVDQQFKTADDLILNGYPYRDSLVIRRNNIALLNIAKIKETDVQPPVANIADETDLIAGEHLEKENEIKVTDDVLDVEEQEDAVEVRLRPAEKIIIYTDEQE